MRTYEQLQDQCIKWGKEIKRYIDEIKRLKVMKETYYKAWSKVYDKCCSLGMNTDNGMSGVENVISFIDQTFAKAKGEEDEQSK